MKATSKQTLRLQRERGKGEKAHCSPSTSIGWGPRRWQYVKKCLFQQKKKNVWPLSELGLLEEALRVPPVHVSNKRWVYIVAQQLLQSFA